MKLLTWVPIYRVDNSESSAGVMSESNSDAGE